MDNYGYIDYAEAHGYELRLTGLGMAYIVIGNVKLTETMDAEKAARELTLIGMAIMTDTVRAM